MERKPGDSRATFIDDQNSPAAHARPSPGRLRFGRTRVSRRLARRRRMDGERMHPAVKLARQRYVDHAVAFEPALPAKSLGHDIHAEVRLAARPMAGVTFVPVGFVFNAQVLGRESLAQLLSMIKIRRPSVPDRLPAASLRSNARVTSSRPAPSHGRRAHAPRRQARSPTLR